MKHDGAKWPYENEFGLTEYVSSDVLVLGGGMAGCFASIAAARMGQKVVLVEKGATEKSGSAGTGFDHWESACTNPCSLVTPEEISLAYVNEQDWYANGIGHYLECREGWDRLLDLESFGGKIRDTEDEFKGALFRDDDTKLMFAYDYKNKFTIRVWGSTFKSALLKELKRLGVRVFDRTEATALLLKKKEVSCAQERNNPSYGSYGDKRSEEIFSQIHRENPVEGYGALGMNVHTGKFMVFLSRSTVLCMSRPARVWLFNADTPGLCEFRPFQSIGSGHAMGWRAGMEFTMMEKSVRAEFSAAGRSFPPYGAGNNHNTWYAATMVDANGRELPYVDRDGNELKNVSDRYYPAKGQKFFLKGGVIDNPKYEYRGPETLEFDELMKRGYRLPFYADLSRMPEAERRVIWGMMVGEEGKTKIPILKNYTDRGFDPEKHMLQSYGSGWQSASFLDQERQFFGAPGGILNDWDLSTSIPGIFAAGDELFASDCAGYASATGYYAGRKAARYALKTSEMRCINASDQSSVTDPRSDNTSDFSPAQPSSSRHNYSTEQDVISSLPAEIAEQIQIERERLYKPLFAKGDEVMSWKELNSAISKAMQNYCGGVKCDQLLEEGIDLLRSYEAEYLPHLFARNPHDLMRVHEVMDILTVAQIVLYSSLARKSSSVPLCFERSDYPEEDPDQDKRHIVIHMDPLTGKISTRTVSLDYFGDLKQNYERYNREYVFEHERGNIAGIDCSTSSSSRHSGYIDITVCSNGNFFSHDDGNVSNDVFYDNDANNIVIDDNSVVDGRGASDAQCRYADNRYQNTAISYRYENVPSSARPILYNQNTCIGCNRCAMVCQCDVLLPDREKGHHPIVAYPGECYYCGACVMVCPKADRGAIRLRHPLMNRAKFVPTRNARV